MAKIRDNPGSGSHKPSPGNGRTTRPLSEAEMRRLALKVEVARELGLWDKVEQGGWGALTSAESGRVGGLMMSRGRRSQHRLLYPESPER